MSPTEHDAAKLKAYYDHQTETYKSMISISVEVYKYLALLNGGAAAGMIATIDKLQIVMNHSALKAALLCFICGLCADGLAILFGYISQSSLYWQSVAHERYGAYRFFIFLICCCAFCSLVAFFLGACQAVFGIK